MKKLFYAAIGATVTLVSASPAFAQTVADDMTKALENRAAISQDLAEVAALTAGSSNAEVVLGESALPVLGFEGPLQVKLDLLAALRADAAKNRGLSFLPGGLSAD